MSEVSACNVGAEVLQRFFGRTQVPDPVVDHRNARPTHDDGLTTTSSRRHPHDDILMKTALPLVDGTSSLSIFTASRNARATPLNEASIT